MNAARTRRACFLAVAAVCAAAAPCGAAVVVLANRTAAPIVVTALVGDEPPRELALDAGDSRPLFAAAPVRVRLPNNDREYELAPDSAYYIGATDAGGAPSLAAIGLGEPPGRAWPPADESKLAEVTAAGEITVKILVDDDERRLQHVWEPVLRQRIADASDVLAAHGGARLRVVAVDSWDSDDANTEFETSLAEFEREVQPGPAQVAIGFTSQYTVINGRTHMGGTRGSFHTHILIKERATNVLETERLELLVHELGHFHGATHSPEPDSVMRPVLSGGLQRRVGSKVRFDPVNTLLISLMGQEIRNRGVRQLSSVAPATRRRMLEIYAALDPTLPDDPATGHYLSRLNTAAVAPLVEDARKVLEQIVRVAGLEKRRRANADPDALGGDQLLEFYVQQAALAAQQVRRENGPQAFVLALGTALDDTDALASLPVAGTVAKYLEGQQQRETRLAVLGSPTMRGRNDLAKHFFVSAYLVAVLGRDAAHTAGLMKELRDADGGSGFSFRDLAADGAGVAFANAVLGGRLTLREVAERFTVESFLPSVDDLREGLTLAEFNSEFGGVADGRFLAELAGIESRINALPEYGNAAAGPAAR